jgi:hypothetical protein
MDAAMGVLNDNIIFGWPCSGHLGDMKERKPSFSFFDQFSVSPKYCSENGSLSLYLARLADREPMPP